MFDRVRSPAPCFTSEPPPDSVPDSKRLWFELMLNVDVPPNVRLLEIESDSVPVVAAVVVTVAPFTSERAGDVAERDRIKDAVEPVAPVLANRIESTLTAPGPMSLVDVVLDGAPRYTSENVPDVVGFVVQLPLVDQLLLAAVPDQVVIVPADAVPAVARQARISSVLRRAEAYMKASWVCVAESVEQGVVRLESSRLAVIRASILSKQSVPVVMRKSNAPKVRNLGGLSGCVKRRER